MAIAALYNGANAADFRQAATQLRLPYWDWAAPGGAVPPPQVYLQDIVKISTPTGQQNVAKCSAVRFAMRRDHEAGEWLVEVREDLAVDASIGLDELDVQVRIERVLHLEVDGH